jgi:hypothetical protein
MEKIIYPDFSFVNTCFIMLLFTYVCKIFTAICKIISIICRQSLTDFPVQHFTLYSIITKDDYSLKFAVKIIAILVYESSMYFHIMKVKTKKLLIF